MQAAFAFGVAFGRIEIIGFVRQAVGGSDDLQALELRAPNDGVLLLAANWSGDKPMVGANLRAGFEFGSLPDTSAMEVEIDLPQIEAQGVQAGDAVVLHPLGRPDQRIDSTLSWVASAAKVRNRESPVKFLSMRAPIPADAIERFRLIPGQRFAASVVLLDARDAIAVPNVAIEQRDDRHWVQVKPRKDPPRQPLPMRCFMRWVCVCIVCL